MAVLIALGEILIIAGFYVLVPGEFRGSVFYLNMLVVSTVYLFNVFNFLNFFPERELIERTVAGLGIKWFFMLAYTFFALLIMVTGLLASIHFKYQLVLQLAALIVLLMGIVISALSSEKSQKLASQQSDERNRKQQINDILLKLMLDFKRVSPGRHIELEIIEKLREKNKMLTISNQLTAQELENEIINELSNLGKLVLFNNNDDEAILEALNRCQILFDQRKQFSTN